MILANVAWPYFDFANSSTVIRVRAKGGVKGGGRIDMMRVEEEHTLILVESESRDREKESMNEQ